MRRLTTIFLASTFSLTANAKVISRTENIGIRILRAEDVLTCFTNDFNPSKGFASLSSSAVSRGAILNGHQYGIVVDEGAGVLCEAVKSMLQQAQDGHPGTGKNLSGLISSTMELEGNKLFENVTLNIFPPADPSRNLVFKSFSERLLIPPQE